MSEKILCPSCLKSNDINKYCIYCGCKLLDEREIRLIEKNCQSYCLNCGRPVTKGDKKCKCGFEFSDVKCPDCGAENLYTSRFCTSCGKKLWKSDVYKYIYPERLFEEHLINQVLPKTLQYTSLYERQKNKIGKNHLKSLDKFELDSRKGLESQISKVNQYLCEISSRWKIISPDYCINCLGIIESGEYHCLRCGSRFNPDKNRIESIQNEKSYVEPNFYDTKCKWTIKSSNYYLQSLAPAIGESQFEYRERLKWEFAENTYLIKFIKERIKNLPAPKPASGPAKTAVKQRGGYCGLGCRFYYEEFLDESGAITDGLYVGGYVEAYCTLGHYIRHGSYCDDYE